MSDESQIEIPPSFIALFVPPGRSKPNASREQIAERYEFCEDLAQLLQERAATTMWELGIEKSDVLARMAAALDDAGTGVDAPQAQWVLCRLDELLELR